VGFAGGEKPQKLTSGKGWEERGDERAVGEVHKTVVFRELRLVGLVGYVKYDWGGGG